MGAPIAQCLQDRRSRWGVLSRYPPREWCSDGFESSSPSTEPGQLHHRLADVGKVLQHDAYRAVAQAHRNWHHQPTLERPQVRLLGRLRRINDRGSPTLGRARGQALGRSVWCFKGSERTRWPVAANMAFTSAGASGGTPVSPTAPQGWPASVPLATM